MEEVLVKQEAETSPEHGCYPHERSVEEHINNGLVVLDKPAGPTSHQVAAWARDMLGAGKAGHSGTLDPGVTGVLPILIGNAAKVMPALAGADKEYVALMRLHKDAPADRIQKTMAGFVGVIRQTPPAKAAVKRVERPRRVHELDVLEIEGRNVLFRAGVEAGTYMRTLCVEAGKKLGAKAHMQELRRTRAGPFTEDEAVTLHDLKDAYAFWKEDGDDRQLREAVRPVEHAVKHIGRLVVKDSAVSAVAHGAPLGVTGVSRLTKGIKDGDRIALLTLKGELVALARARMSSEDIIHRRKGVAAAPDRVVIAKDAYPRAWSAKK